MLSRLAKSKTAKSLFLAGWLTAAAGMKAYAQPQESEIVEDLSPRFEITRFQPAKYFPGLGVEVEPVPNRFYRDDGLVKSISEHLGLVMKETGYSLTNENLEDKEKMIGHCSNRRQTRDGTESRMSIVFCQSMKTELVVYCRAHEDMHAANFMGSPIRDNVYGNLAKRFEKQGFRVSFPDFDEEEQADMAGILRVMEYHMPVEPLFEYLDSAGKTYNKLLEYKIQ
jgi:hypothetical protein